MSKTAEQYTQDWLDAFNIVSQAALKEIKTDSSILCNIIDASKRSEGKYTVKPVAGVGAANFIAVSENKTYEEKDQVYVTIPNSDFNEEKIITGKKDQKNGVSYTYVSPEQTVVKTSKNFLANAQYLIGGVQYSQEILNFTANVNTETTPPTVPAAQSITLTLQNPVTIEPGAADKILIKMKEKTDFPINGVKSGNFGIRITLQSVLDSTQTKDILFDTEDMVGNIYGFNDYLEQVLLGDLKDLPKDNKIDAWKQFKIEKIDFFQMGDFKNWYGETYQPIGNTTDQPTPGGGFATYKEDIFFSLPDLEIYLAADVKGLTEDRLEITTDRTEYHRDLSGAQKDIINTTFSWIHKENGAESKLIKDFSNYIVEVYHFVQSSNNQNAFLGKGWVPMYSTTTSVGKSYLKFNEKFYELNTINNSEKIRVLISSGSTSADKKLICTSNEINLINANPIEVSNFEKYQDVDITFEDAGLNGNYFVYNLDNSLKQIYQIPKVAKFVYSDKVTASKQNSLYPFWKVNDKFLYLGNIDLERSMLDSAIENADKSLTYTIKPQYNQNYTRNLISCEFYYYTDVVDGRPANGAKPAYIAERLLNFGLTALYNGTGYFITYEIESAAAESAVFNPVQYPALDGENRSTLRIIPTLHDPNGEIVEDKEWTWTWGWGGEKSEAAQSIDVYYSEEAPDSEGEEEEDIRTGRIVPWLGKVSVNIGTEEDPIIIDDYFSVAKAHPIYQANTISNKIIYDSASGYPFEDTKSWKLGLTPSEPQVQWLPVEYEKIDDENVKSMAYLTPAIDPSGYLIPEQLGGDMNLMEHRYKLSATATIDEDPEIVWEEYLIIRKNLWPSSIFNNWNGEFKVDEANGVIYSPRYVAGRKDGDKFTGVAIGDFSGTDSEGGLTEATGIFGFKNGNQVYALKDNGTMFIQTPDGNGRIDLSAVSDESQSLGIVIKNINDKTEQPESLSIGILNPVAQQNFLEFKQNDVIVLSIGEDGFVFNSTDSLQQSFQLSKDGINVVDNSNNLYGVFSSQEFKIVDINSKKYGTLINQNQIRSNHVQIANNIQANKFWDWKIYQGNNLGLFFTSLEGEQQ